MKFAYLDDLKMITDVAKVFRHGFSKRFSSKKRDHFYAFRARSCLAGLALAIHGRLNVNAFMFFQACSKPKEHIHMHILSDYICICIYIYIIHLSIDIRIIMYLQNY